jgi:hypothetical protein
MTVLYHPLPIVNFNNATAHKNVKKMLNLSIYNNKRQIKPSSWMYCLSYGSKFKTSTSVKHKPKVVAQQLLNLIHAIGITETQVKYLIFLNKLEMVEPICSCQLQCQVQLHGSQASHTVLMWHYIPHSTCSLLRSSLINYLMPEWIHCKKYIQMYYQKIVTYFIGFYIQDSRCDELGKK